MPSLTDKPDYPLTLRQTDQARSDFTAIEGDLQFVMSQLARVPTRAYLCRNIVTIHRQSVRSARGSRIVAEVTVSRSNSRFFYHGVRCRLAVDLAAGSSVRTLNTPFAVSIL